MQILLLLGVALYLILCEGKIIRCQDLISLTICNFLST